MQLSRKKIQLIVIAVAMICVYHEKAFYFPPLNDIDFKYELKKLLSKKQQLIISDKKWHH